MRFDVDEPDPGRYEENPLRADDEPEKEPMNELRQAESALVAVVNALDNAGDECDDRADRLMIKALCNEADRLLCQVQKFMEKGAAA